MLPDPIAGAAAWPACVPCKHAGTVPEPGVGALQGSGLPVFRAAWLGLSPFPGEREMKTDHVLGAASWKPRASAGKGTDLSRLPVCESWWCFY